MWRNVTTPTMKALGTGPGLIILKRSQVQNTMGGGGGEWNSYQVINRRSNKIKWQPDKETQHSTKVTLFHTLNISNTMKRLCKAHQNPINTQMLVL